MKKRLTIIGSIVISLCGGTIWYLESEVARMEAEMADIPTVSMSNAPEHVRAERARRRGEAQPARQPITVDELRKRREEVASAS